MKTFRRTLRQYRAPARWFARTAAAAVELAVVLPLLMLLALAAVDFGRVVYAYPDRLQCGT